MQRLTIILFLFNFACSHSQNRVSHEILFPIVENDRWGYMNLRGQIVVRPQFEQAGIFSEGLAAVRNSGKYGYINARGKVVIDEEFDFAYAFSNGYALVYRNGIPQIIRKDGNPVFKNTYPDLTMVNETSFIVSSPSHAKGIVDAKGKLKVDTLFTDITPTDYGLYIVRGVRNKVSNYSDDVGVIDDNGKFTVPYGIYRYIWPYKNGLARVEVQTPNDNNDFDGFIDPSGNLAFKITNKKIWKAEDFNGDLCKVNLLAKEENYSRDDYYEGFINKKGELFIDDNKYRSVFGYTNNRAFISTRDDNYYLLDKTGKQINKSPYRAIREEGFVDGKAFVASDDNWQVIDTNANVLMKQDIDFESSNYLTNALFYYDDHKWRFWDLEKNQVPKVVFDYYDPAGFRDGLLMVQDEQRLSYIDRSGKKIWEQQKAEGGRARPLNIDYMQRGYYYAYSTVAKEEANYNGWARSGNVPGQNASYDWIENGKLNLHLSNEDTTIDKVIKAKKLFIVNATSDTTYFPAQDSRLYLTIQALDPINGWKDIEYLPSSWCGNSYHTLKLAPKEYWSFATPEYTGGFKTKLRAVLRYQSAKTEGRDAYVVIYSNEFEGSINPAQFWRKLEYQRGGLMDPYND